MWANKLSLLWIISMSILEVACSNVYHPAGVGLSNNNNKWIARHSTDTVLIRLMQCVATPHVASSTHRYVDDVVLCRRLIRLSSLVHLPDFSPAQSLFLLPEVDAVRSLPTNPQVAVEISDGTLVWEGGGPSAQTSPSVRTSAGQRRHLDRYPHPPAPCPGDSKATCS